VAAAAGRAAAWPSPAGREAVSAAAAASGVAGLEGERGMRPAEVAAAAARQEAGLAAALPLGQQWAQQRARRSEAQREMPLAPQLACPKGLQLGQ